MSSGLRKRWMIFASTALAASILFLAAFSAYQRSNLLQDMRSGLWNNIAYAAAEADVEMYRFIGAVDALALAGSLTHPHLVDEAEERFEIVLGRFYSLSEGQIGGRILGNTRAKAAAEKAIIAVQAVEDKIAVFGALGKPEQNSILADLHAAARNYHASTIEIALLGDFEQQRQYKTLIQNQRIDIVLLGLVFLLGAFAIVNSIYDRRRIIMLNETLEYEVEARTVELKATNIALVEEIAEREKAEAETHDRNETIQRMQKLKAIGQLTGGVAHDFNNLLAVILGNAELIEVENPENARMLQAIINATERGAELTQRLLAYARKTPLRPEPVQLDSLINDMASLLSRTLGETIEVTTDLPDDLWIVSVDPGQIENALVNLALNARDSMKNGGALNVSCKNLHVTDGTKAQQLELEPGDYVILSVSDVGSGMSKAVREQAFEPFFTTKEVGEGSGLGLSMVYGFAHQSGGTAIISSVEGEGTTVSLYLPRTHDVPKRLKVNKKAAPRSRSGEHILVLEDEAEVRWLIERSLVALGYTVTTASDAAQARNVVDAQSDIALVLSDIVLPGGASGPDFAAGLQKTHPEIPVIFMSGYPAGTFTERDEPFAVHDVLMKPFETSQLAQRISQALQG